VMHCFVELSANRTHRVTCRRTSRCEFVVALVLLLAPGSAARTVLLRGDIAGDAEYRQAGNSWLAVQERLLLGVHMHTNAVLAADWHVCVPSARNRDRSTECLSIDQAWDRDDSVAAQARWLSDGGDW
jgi:hypothetical protein